MVRSASRVWPESTQPIRLSSFTKPHRFPCPQSHAVGRQCLHLQSLYPSPQPGSHTVNAGPVAPFACPAVPDCAGVGDAEISILESAGAQYLQRASSLPLCMQPGSQGMKGAATPDVGLIAPAVAAMPRRTTRCIAMPRNALAIPFATLLQHTRDSQWPRFVRSRGDPSFRTCTLITVMMRGCRMYRHSLSA